MTGTEVGSRTVQTGCNAIIAHFVERPKENQVIWIFSNVIPIL